MVVGAGNEVFVDFTLVCFCCLVCMNGALQRHMLVIWFGGTADWKRHWWRGRAGRGDDTQEHCCVFFVMDNKLHQRVAVARLNPF